MNTISLFVSTIILGICVAFVHTFDLSVETYCEGTGWVPYRDEKCLKLIKDFKTRDQASEMCAQEWIQSDTSTPQLISIKSVQEQTFLTEFLFDTEAIEGTVWIGARRRQEDGERFVWDDGSEVEYTNWDQGSPTEENRRGCVEMQSEFTRKFSNSSKNQKFSKKGKWRDVTCNQGNYVICQKMQRWSFGKLQEALLETRKQLVDSIEVVSAELGDTKSQLVSTQNELSATKTDLSSTKLDLSITKSELSATKTELSNLKQNLIPIGFIYNQLPSDKAPNEIWPWMTWTDVSSAYEGVFFRVTGGEAAPFGQVQDNNAPRLTKVAAMYVTGSSGEKDLPINDWSNFVYTGDNTQHETKPYPVYMKFYTSGGEVRPRNTAIRIWKRTG